MSIEDIIRKSTLISATVTLEQELGKLKDSELHFVAPIKYADDIEICMVGEGHNGEILYRSPNGTALFMAAVFIEAFCIPEYGTQNVEFTIRCSIYKTLNAQVGSENVENYYMDKPFGKHLWLMPKEKEYYGKKIIRTLKLM